MTAAKPRSLRFPLPSTTEEPARRGALHRDRGRRRRLADRGPLLGRVVRFRAHRAPPSRSGRRRPARAIDPAGRVCALSRSHQHRTPTGQESAHTTFMLQLPRSPAGSVRPWGLRRANAVSRHPRCERGRSSRPSLRAALLQLSGREVRADGRPVSLRGIGIGNWMLIEHFMLGLPQVDHVIRHAFRELLGETAAEGAFSVPLHGRLPRRGGRRVPPLPRLQPRPARIRLSAPRVGLQPFDVPRERLCPAAARHRLVPPPRPLRPAGPPCRPRVPGRRLERGQRER